ncbi:MAG: acyl-CoA thioesterase [Acidimicrobiia bacterium]
MTTYNPVPHLPSFTELLDLEELDRDLYRGLNEIPPNDRPTLYGGQVAAQALRAAGLTVPEGRYPHSLHSYFLRVGQRAKPVIYKVERDRDGGSFSSRRVSAIQDGEVIFDMSASFHVDRTGPEYLREMRTDLVPPDDCEPESFNQNFPSCEARLVPPLRLTPMGRHLSTTLWVRIRQPLPDDRLIQGCALTYVSDIGSGFTGPATMQMPIAAASLDHAMWFRSPVRADQWCLLDQYPVMAGGARGLYGGSIHSADGTLGAMLSQEMLFREGQY